MLNTIENYPHYIGFIENRFKDQFYKHKNSFRYEIKRNAKISMPTLKRLLFGIY